MNRGVSSRVELRLLLGRVCHMCVCVCVCVLHDSQGGVLCVTHIFVCDMMLLQIPTDTRETCVAAAQSTQWTSLGWLRLVSSLKLQDSVAKEPYKRINILQESPIVLRSLLIVATLYRDTDEQYCKKGGGEIEN